MKKSFNKTKMEFLLFLEKRKMKRENIKQCLDLYRSASKFVNNNFTLKIESLLNDIFKSLINLLDDISKLASSDIITSYYSIIDIILKLREMTKDITGVTPIIDDLINLIDKGCCFEYLEMKKYNN
jgi:hypothetical protein